MKTTYIHLKDKCYISDVLVQVQEQLDSVKEKMSTSRTAQLWFQYMEMVDILRCFIRAEHTGNWLLHLQSVQQMLPFLAASGHNLYTKSLFLYLQSMDQLVYKLSRKAFKSRPLKWKCEIVV